MQTFPDITPIKLLAGDHEDTATTGQGCFINLISYLNGEAQITDDSPCVCVMVRPLAIALNDRANNEQRQRMLPFVLRAMGSATDDRVVIESRMRRMRQYGAEGQELQEKFKSDLRALGVNADGYAYAYADGYAYAAANANANDSIDDAADVYAAAYGNAYAYAIIAAADAYGNGNGNGKKKTTALALKHKADLFDVGLRYLDDVLPPAEPVGGEIMARAEKLLELAAA